MSNEPEEGTHDIGGFTPFIETVPPDLQDAALLLAFHLFQINQYGQQFTASVALLDFADLEDRNRRIVGTPLSPNSRNLFKFWREMAARDAAISIYHLGKTLTAIATNTSRLQAFTGAVDLSAIERARKRLNESFPGYTNLRDGVGHIAENTSSVGKIASHAVDGQLFFGGLKGRTFTITHKGSHHSLMLSPISVQTLAVIIREVYSAFPRFESVLPKVSFRAGLIDPASLSSTGQDN